MHSPRSLAGLALAAIFVFLGSARADDDKQTIQAGDLPPAVAKTIKSRWPKAAVKKVQKITKGDATSYVLELSMTRQDKPVTIDVTLDSAGKVTNWENPESKVALANLPPKVLATAKQRFPGAELVKAEKENEEGKLIYEITLKHEGKNLEAEFSPEGEYLEMEESIEISALPAAVKAALDAKYAQATYRHAGKVTKNDNSINYEVVVQTKDGKRGEVVISPTGEIIKGLDH